MRRPILTAAALSLLAFPAAAGAATVDSRTTCEAEGRICGSEITFSAAPFETNTVTATRDSAGAFVLNDSTAPITSATGCDLVDEHTARCTPASGPGGGPLGAVTASLRDLDDSFTAGPNAGAVVDGGTGNDRLEAVAVSYASRNEPLTIDLTRGVGGADDEDDELVGVVSVEGGGGGDFIRGRDGADFLEGRNGNDSLEGGAGIDAYDGGAGSDTLSTQEPSGSGRAESVTCGTGDDDVGASSGSTPFADPLDRLANDCEHVRAPGFEDMRPRPQVSNGKAILRLDSSCGCSARVTLTTVIGSKRTVVGNARVKDNRRRVVVPLTRTGRRLMRSGVLVEVTIRADGDRAGWSARL
jgi:hypothetical protein